MREERGWGDSTRQFCRLLFPPSCRPCSLLQTPQKVQTLPLHSCQCFMFKVNAALECYLFVQRHCLQLCSESLSAVVFRVALCSCVQRHCLQLCSESLSAVVFRVALCSCVQRHCLQLCSESLSAVVFRVALCSCIWSLSAVVFLCGGVAVCTELSCVLNVLLSFPSWFMCLI